MNATDRRFSSWLAIVFGPLFVIGGFLTAFTIVGAILIWAGISLFAAGLVLRTRLPVLLIIAAIVLTLLLSLSTVSSYR